MLNLTYLNGQRGAGKMKFTSKIGFVHDYSREFGGEKRLFKYYTVYKNGEVLIRPSIKWNYSRPNVYMIDTCLQDENGYIFIDCKSRQECHKWLELNWDKLTA